jgi:HK97 gp10 family phage protein
MSVSVQWQGLEQITAAFAEAKKIVTDEIIPYVLTYAIQLAEQEAKQVCPVRTGFLRASIQVEQGIGVSDIGGQSERLVATAPYAGFVERGTGKMVGRFYMQSAFMTALPAMSTALSERIGEAFAYTGRHFA